MSDPDAPPAPTPPVPPEATAPPVIGAMELTAPAPPENPYKAGEPSPFSLGVDTSLTVPEAPPRPAPMALEDLETVGPDYWMELNRAYIGEVVDSDAVYTAASQRVADEESPLLQDQRAQQAQAAAAVPLPPERPAAPAPPAPTGPSTADQIAQWMSSVGIQVPEAQQPASSFVDAMYRDTPNPEANPVYLTLKRLAAPIDAALTASNVVITSVSNAVSLVASPLIMGLRAAGAPEELVQSTIHTMRAIPQGAALVATGGASGPMALLGELGNADLAILSGLAGPVLSTTIRAAVARAGLLEKVRNDFRATMTDLWGQRGEVLIPGPIPPNTPESIAAKFAKTTAEQRRGVRSLEQTGRAAQELIDSGAVSLEAIRQISPGTLENAEYLGAVVKLLVDEGTRIKSMAHEALLLEGPAADQAARNVVQEFYLMGLTLSPKRLGLLAESGRATGSLNEPVSGMNQFLGQFDRLMQAQTVEMTPLDIVRAIVDFETPGQLAVAAAQTAKPGYWDAFREYYITGLLWGPKTWMANALGNTTSAVWQIGERALVAPDEAMVMMKAVIAAQTDAWRVAKEGLITRESAFEAILHQQYPELFKEPRTFYPQRALSSSTFGLTGMPGAAVDFLGAVQTFPTGVLRGTDDYFKVIAFRAEHQALALRQAKADAAAAGEAGTAYRDLVNRQYAHYLTDPPPDMVQAAYNYSLYSTFTQELGPWAKGLQTFSRTPFGTLTVPFVGAPTNMAKWVNERTPLGLATRGFWTDINGPDPVKARLAAAKMALGSLSMAMAGQWAQNGILNGPGPPDKGQRNLMTELGWQPMSARIGNLVMSIDRLEPAGWLLGFAASYAEATMNLDPEDPEQVKAADEAAVAGSVAAAKVMSSRTMLQGLAQGASVLANPEQSSAGAVAGLAFSVFVPMSAMVRQSARALHPALLEADTVLDKFRAMIPALGPWALNDKLDLDGKPIYLSSVYGPVGITTVKNDPVKFAMLELGVNWPPIPKVVGGMALTKEMRHDWALQRGTMVDGGKTLRGALEAYMASSDYRTLDSKEMKAVEFHRIIQNYTTLALEDHVYKKYPELERAVDARREQRMDKLLGGPRPSDKTIPPFLKSIAP